MLIQQDCLDYLKTLPDECVDSLITDPPAGIGFMGKEWDDDKGGREPWIAWMKKVMQECLRVLKPGAHGLVWAIPRTSHWTATALEDAGFEVRDVVTHLFGSGFPKSLDISKAIDKAAGAEREITKQGQTKPPEFSGKFDNSTSSLRERRDYPSTPEAKTWQGWGTALKPASEHWILVRKPLSEKTVAANVLKWGCGGIHIDASRIGTESTRRPLGKSMSGVHIGSEERNSRPSMGIIGGSESGRFPANLVLSHNEDCVEVGTKKVKPQTGIRKKNNSQGSGSEMFAGGLHDSTTDYVNPDGTETVAAWECTEGCAVAELDRISIENGVHLSGKGRASGTAKQTANGGVTSYVLGQNPNNGMRYQDGTNPGASRFFYCAKASKRDKGADNNHPTVKSSKLMTYLITMITPPNGLVLDPFMGSGSTGVAAKKSGFRFIGVEKDLDYFEIAKRRILSEEPVRL